MKSARLLRALSAVLVVLSIISFIALAITAFLAPEELKAFFDTFIGQIHRLGLIGSVLIMTVAALTAFPAELPAIACGAMYGVTFGFAVTWVSAMIGASVAFWVGRYVHPSFLKSLVGERIFTTIRKRSNEKTGIMTLFLVRLIPWFPFFLVNFASGMSSMRYTSYLLATGAGIIPGALVSNAIGAGLLFTNAVIVLIALSIFMLLVFLLRIYRSSNG